MARQGSHWAARLSLAFGATLVGLALCEIAARILLRPPELIRVVGLSERPEAESSAPRKFTRLNLVASNKPLYIRTKTGRRFRPNMVGHIKNNRNSGLDVTIRTNSLGHRGRELGPKTQPRALFLGDSITAAGFINEEHTFVRRVEQLSKASPQPFETINAGVGAIGLESEYAILVETGILTEPDVVVVGFYLNDVEISPGVQSLDVPAHLEWSYLLQHLAHQLPLATWEDTDIDLETHQAWSKQVRRNFPPGPGDPKKDRAAFNQLIGLRMRDWGSAWSEGAWRKMEPIFLELKRLAAVHDFELVIVVFPVKEQVVASFVPDYPQRRLAAFAKELGIPVLDLLPLFRRAVESTNAEALFYDHCHHTPTGQGLVAGWIYEFLRTHTQALAYARVSAKPGARVESE